MRLLLDTHILIAVVEARADDLRPSIGNLLSDADNEFYVSVASLWEIAIKHRLGKLPIGVRPEDLPTLISGMGFILLDIKAAHALASVEPEPPTRDPFDRLLLAQCQIESLQFVTIDRALVGHPRAV